MVSLVVYISLVVATLVSFWSSLVEATYLTVRPVSLNAAARSGTKGAVQAPELIREKTRLVSTTTFLDTMTNVALASSIGLIFSEFFGPSAGYSTILGSFLIIIFLFLLLPKAIRALSKLDGVETLNMTLNRDLLFGTKFIHSVVRVKMDELRMRRQRLQTLAE